MACTIFGNIGPSACKLLPHICQEQNCANPSFVYCLFLKSFDRFLTELATGKHLHEPLPKAEARHSLIDCRISCLSTACLC